ncbi:MAG TPA: DUF302 domain-containing protein [Candidatus Aquilonibacter sp.]|nr:DUF302 domain-containing protein [Candidatus Aquilonibacter sp.]
MNVESPLTYGHVVETKLSYERALETAKEYLKAEGFGIQCQIDIAATMKEKLGVEHEPYTILGACNPSYAHLALTQHPQIGLLLPCNVVVQKQGEKTIVSAIDARSLMKLVDPVGLASVAEHVDTSLRRVLERIASAVA